MAPAIGMSKYASNGIDDNISPIDGRNSIIFKVANEYAPNIIMELIIPPIVPIKMPSIKKGSLVNALVAPSSLIVSISSFLRWKNILMVQ